MAGSPIVFPVPGGTYTNDWGGPRSGGNTHKGTDIFAKHGAPIVAIEDGVITKAGDDGGKGGLRLWINGTWYYAHMSKLARGIKVGARVKAGQIVGYVGTSGDAKGTSPHLHLGYDPSGSHSANGSWENPYPLLTNLRRGKPVESSNVPSVTQDAGDVREFIDPETARRMKMDASMSVGPRPISPGLIDPIPLPGEAPSYGSSRAPQLETWRSLSALPYVSQETLRYRDMAELGYGDG